MNFLKIQKKNNQSFTFKQKRQFLSKRQNSTVQKLDADSNI